VNPTFSAKLLERVLVTIGVAFAGVYSPLLLGLNGVAGLHEIESLSLAHKALVAGVAGVVQLVLGSLIAPHVGDPDSPDLIPAAWLKRLKSVPSDISTFVKMTTGLSVSTNELSVIVAQVLHDLEVKYGSDVPIDVDELFTAVVAAVRLSEAAKSAVKTTAVPA
jgi:hypothetical protein